MPDAAAPRATCPRCRRPITVCYCEALPCLPAATPVVILQHPRERTKAIGTARMASLALPSSTLHVGVRWDDHAPLRAALTDPARPPILLYPGPGARDLLVQPPPHPVTLVVVDGTWAHARAVVRDNPVLRALPRYAFSPPSPSEYRIRREPHEDCVSTIEAVMHALGALEGDPARFAALRDPLRAMVDAHLARQEARRDLSSKRTRRPRPRSAPAARLPAELRGPADDLVCVVGEANAWPYRGRAPGLADELVHWVARRLGAGATFAAVAAPRGPMAPSTALHTRLPEATLRDGSTPAALGAAFSSFVREPDVLCAWGDYPVRLYEADVGSLPPRRVDVRAVCQQVFNRRLGALEDVAAELAPGAAPLADGRAGARLGMLAGVVEALRRL